MTGSLPGAENMAIDEVLLHSVGEGISRPTLRLYQWNPPCLSLGYSQRINGINLEACTRLGLDVVRRLTGGRAVLHDRELTYSLVFPIDHPLGKKSVSEVFHEINLCLIRGLKSIGVEGSLGMFKVKHNKIRDNMPSNFCFLQPRSDDIGAAGRKLVGSAQRRLQKAILHHGSILLSWDPERLLAILPQGHPKEPVLARVTSLEELLGTLPSLHCLVEAIRKGFEEGLGVRFFLDELNRRELMASRVLSLERYSAPWWTGRR